MYIAKRHYVEEKKVELILVKTWLFSILLKITNTSEFHFKIFKESGGAYSNDDVIQEEILLMITADYRAGVQNGQKSDDVLSTIPMRCLFAPIDKFEMQGFH